eukprot:12612055-Ditylum_brightwellii.AAC.1
MQGKRWKHWRTSGVFRSKQDQGGRRRQAHTRRSRRSRESCAVGRKREVPGQDVHHEGVSPPVQETPGGPTQRSWQGD